MTTPADAMPLRELLLHLLEYTSTDVIDELWPDDKTTLDEIAGEILARDAHELAEKQRDYTSKMNDPHGPYRSAVALTDLLTSLIDPKKKT